MKFDAKWPNPESYKHYGTCTSDEVIYVPTRSKSVKCDYCNAPTGPWYNPSFGVIFCSEECLAAMWREYARAVEHPVEEDMWGGEECET